MNESYKVPADLVHKAIWSIIGSIFLIGLYMVAWAINFAVFEKEMRLLQVEHAQLQKEFKEHNEKHCHDVDCEKSSSLSH